MKKIILPGAVFFIALFSTATINAQTEPPATVSNSVAEASVANKSEGFASFGAREFRLVKSFSDDATLPARRQTYVRPTKEQRLKRYLSDGFGVPALIGAGIGATFNQIGNNPPEWKKTADGFGKRFASSYGTDAIENTVTYGLSEAFKLDNLYVKSTQKNFGKRLQHVLIASYTTRTPNGKRLPDFPYIIGTYTANIAANTIWYPKRYGVQDGVRDGSYSLGFNFGINLLREFVFRK